MENRLSELIDELHDGFCSIRMDGELVYANQSAHKLLKISDTDNYNFFEDFVRDKKLISELKENITKRLSIKDVECDLFNSEKHNFPVILTANPIRDIDGDTIGMALLFKDMSTLAAMHAQLVQAQKMESVGMLTAGIAHEFNNILAGIIPNAELIKMTIEAENPNYTRADSIHKSAQRAASFIKQLLSFARNDDVKENISLNLAQTVSETLEIMGKLFGKEITVENELPVSLPPIKADPTRVQQIIMNLAINARDAIQNSGTITFTAEAVALQNEAENGLQPGRYVKLSIEDTGKGIEKHNLDKIFNPFFTTKEPGKGTGLGLSVVYGIVKNLKGHITVHSVANQGTRFDVFLPVSEYAPQGETEQPYVDTRKRNKTILIVEDEKVIREMAKDMLSYLGFETIAVQDAIEALEVYRRQQVDIDMVLLDLIMPRMNGVTCLHKMREINPEVQVVITSGVGEVNKRDDMLRIGAVDYIEKPYSIKAFDELFSRIISSAQ